MFTGRVTSAAKPPCPAILTERSTSGSGRASTGADFTGALLSGIDLSGANLENVILVGADLTGANLAGADLLGVDLTVLDAAAELPLKFDVNGNRVGSDLASQARAAQKLLAHQKRRQQCQNRHSKRQK
mgnify:CR=1 FL=1